MRAAAAATAVARLPASSCCARRSFFPPHSFRCLRLQQKHVWLGGRRCRQAQDGGDVYPGSCRGAAQGCYLPLKLPHTSRLI